MGVQEFEWQGSDGEDASRRYVDCYLDQAIVAYRENPTDENREWLMGLQAQHANRFYRSQATEFIRRTH